MQVVVVIVAVLGGLVGLVGLVSVVAYLSARWFFVDRTPDEIHFAATDDGWRVAISRRRPRTPGPVTEPVVLVHGLATNRLHLDLTEELSLAEHLAAAGFDVWIVELRGRGLSTRPRLFSRYRYDWSFDEYVERDLPVALAEVRRATGAEKVHCVGVAVGGLVFYGLLGRPEHAAGVRSLVALAAPATFRFQGKYLFAWPLKSFRWVRHRLLMRLLAPLAGYRYLPSVRLLYEKENLSGETLRRFMVNAAASFGRDELLQYGDWLEHDVFRSIDHRRDYRAAMREATVPALFIAGNKDRLAPPPAVKDAHDLWGTPDKRLVIASRGGGLRRNYGHLDLVLGEETPADVVPLVAGWIRGHAAGAGEQAGAGEGDQAAERGHEGAPA